MTIASTTNRVSASGNGVTTSFAFNYPVLAAADLKVYVDDTLKTLTTDYTLSGTAPYTSGTNVQFVTAPAVSTTVVIVRDPAITQEVDLVNGDDLDVDAEIETPLDRLTLICQRLDDRVSRSLTLADSDTTSATLELPSPSAGSVIGWNAAADGLDNYAAADIDLALVSTFGQTLLDDTDAGTATATILGDVITPTTLAANTDNWAPTGLSAATMVRVAASAAYDLTGITAPADRRVLVLHNVGTFAITLKDNATSTAANRFQLNGDCVLSPDASAILQYDTTSARWRMLAQPGAASGSITTSGYTMSTSRLLGRTTASSGAVEELTVGSGLSLSGGSLTASGATLSTTTSINSGSSVNVASIPAGTNEIVIDISLLSTTGTANPLLQLGDSGGIESSSYSGSGATNGTTHANNSTGFFLAGSTAAATTLTATYVLRRIDSAAHTWSISGGGHRADGNAVSAYGQKTLSAELTQFTLSTTDAFDGSGVFTYTTRK